MSIIISNDPANSPSSENLLTFQDWGPLPNPHSNELYYFPNAGLEPESPTIIFKIKDVIGVPAYSQYTAFRLRSAVHYYGGTPSTGAGVVWVTPATYTDQGYSINDAVENAVEILENGLQFEFSPTYQNLGALGYTTFRFNHNFYIQGQTTEGVWVTLSSYQHSLHLTVGQLSIYPPVNPLLFQHTQGGSFQTRSAYLYSYLPFAMIGNPRISISSNDSGVVIEEVTDDTGTYQIVSFPNAVGACVLYVTLTDFYDLLGEYSPELLSGVIPIRVGTSTIVGYINYSIQLFTAPGLTVAEENIYFNAIKGFQEAPPQNVAFQCSVPDYAIASSPWLNVSESIVTVNGITSTVMMIQPISSVNMATGTYTGFVSITAEIDGADITRTIAVTYMIQDFVYSDYNNSVISFTLDDIELKFSTVYPDTSFEMLLSIRVYDFYTNQPTLTELPYKIPLMRGSNKMNIGTIVDRTMKKFAALNMVPGNEYYPAEVSFSVKEVNNSNGFTLREFESVIFKFIAGYKPNISYANYCVLALNDKPTRITPLSFAYVNLFLPAGTYKFWLRINTVETVLQQNFLVPTDTVRSLRLQFSDYQIREGDVVEFCAIEITAGANNIQRNNYVLRKFICFPEGKHSNHIIWEDFYKVKSIMEFTGDFKTPVEIDALTHTHKRSLSEIIVKLKSSVIKKFTINTGWVLKDDADFIEDLLLSERAWLSQPQGSPVEMVCIGKSITKEDSTRGLYEYDIEFQLLK